MGVHREGAREWLGQWYILITGCALVCVLYEKGLVLQCKFRELAEDMLTFLIAGTIKQPFLRVSK